ncbi:unnamed protein product [Amoebophrya sp. A25]|nr:unnamed protein product [Amoebophrya sp. A25]|eukprot:GSA25T00007698001.1
MPSSFSSSSYSLQDPRAAVIVDPHAQASGASSSSSSSATNGKRPPQILEEDNAKRSRGEVTIERSSLRSGEGDHVTLDSLTETGIADDEEATEMCVICLDEVDYMVLKMTACGHYFCGAECRDRNRSQHGRCPSCRCPTKHKRKTELEKIRPRLRPADKYEDYKQRIDQDIRGSEEVNSMRRRRQQKDKIAENQRHLQNWKEIIEAYGGFAEEGSEERPESSEDKNQGAFDDAQIQAAVAASLRESQERNASSASLSGNNAGTSSSSSSRSARPAPASHNVEPSSSSSSSGSSSSLSTRNAAAAPTRSAAQAPSVNAGTAGRSYFGGSVFSENSQASISLRQGCPRSHFPTTLSR